MTAVRLGFLAVLPAALALTARAQSWIGGNSTSWGSNGNWTGAYPNSPAAVATFDSNFASGNHQPSLNKTITVGELDFANSLGQSVTLSGSHELTIDGSGGVGIDDLSPTQTVTLSVGITLGAAQTWQGDAFTIDSAVTNGGFALTLAPNSGQTIALGGDLSGTGGLTADGAGTVSVTAAQDYTGATTLTSGTLSTSLLAAGGTSSGIGASTNAAANLVLNGGALQYTGAAQSTDRLFTLGTSGGTIDASGTGALTLSNAGSVAYSAANNAESLTLTGTSTAGNTLASIVGNNGTGATSITKSGAGTWILSAANTYSGATAVGAGTLQAGSTSSFGTNSAVTVSSGATLALANNANSVGSIAGAGSITLGSATLTTGGDNTSPTFSGSISGTGGLTKNGTGTQTLSGTSSYTGVTTIAGGTLSVATLANGGTNSGIGASTNAAANLVLNGGTLQYTGAGASTDRLFTLGTAGGTVAASGTGALTLSNTGSVAYSTTNHAETLTLSGTSTAANTLDAVIGNDGTGVTSLTKSGTGTWDLGSAETYTGTTTVSAGTLGFEVNNQLGTGNALTISGGATANLGNFVQSIGTISGAGAIDFGTSTTLSQLTLNANSTFSGSFAGTGTLIVGSGVTLTLGADFNDSSLNIELNGGTLDLNGNNGIFGNLIVAGNSAIDFNSASNSDIEFQNVSMSNGAATLAVTNFTLLSDYFYSVSQSQTANTLNQPQLNQIAFTGDAGRQTVWDANQAINSGPDAGIDQIRPVIPEPGTYGAIFVAMSLAVLLMRRRLCAQVVG